MKSQMKNEEERINLIHSQHIAEKLIDLGLGALVYFKCLDDPEFMLQCLWNELELGNPDKDNLYYLVRIFNQYDKSVTVFTNEIRRTIF
jgi:hypothetical protein